MADGPSLGDFFAKKTKKKIVGSNLNKEATAAKPAPKKKAKDAEEDGWEEEQVAAPTMKVEVAGKLMREEDKKEEEDTAAPAWGAPKGKESKAPDLSDKKYPTLAKSVQSSNINIDDGSEAKVNIATSKNVFAALEAQDDEDSTKRPTEIKPAMVQKKQGERTTVAIQREVDKYSGKKDEKKKGGDEDEGDEEDEDDDEEAPEADETREVAKPKKKKEEKKEEAKAPEPEAVVEDDVSMKPDLVAAKAKYVGRKKLPKVELSREELAEEKENQKPRPVKKKWANIEEDDEKAKKLTYWEED